MRLPGGTRQGSGWPPRLKWCGYSAGGHGPITRSRSRSCEIQVRSETSDHWFPTTSWTRLRRRGPAPFFPLLRYPRTARNIRSAQAPSGVQPAPGGVEKPPRVSPDRRPSRFLYGLEVEYREDDWRLFFELRQTRSHGRSGDERMARWFAQRRLRQRLWKIHPKLYRTAYAWCHDAALADDLIQEAMRKGG